MSFEQYARTLGEHWSGGGVGLVVLRRLPSTHLLGRRVVQDYSDEGASAPPADFLAWQQTAGKGRENRPWTSPAGTGVYATILRSVEPSQLQTLPLTVGIALCRAVNNHLDDRCRVKWPNDLWVNGKKLGGILIDVSSRGEDRATVISFGVNHGPDLDVPGATSMELEAPGRVALAALARQLIQAVDEVLASPERTESIVDHYQQLSAHRVGDSIRCRAEGGELEGVFLGFDRHGFLRLSVAGEERLLTAGEVMQGD